MRRLLAVAAWLLAGPAGAEVPVLKAELLRRLPAPEARQGVAVDARHVYAIDNSAIGKYDKATGAKVGQWTGDRGRFPHINSCEAVGPELVCASSNYPAVPMTSSVEVFDARRMVHLRTVPLGQQVGSLTWVVRHAGAWWAAFANYDARGGEPGRDHRHTQLVRFDDQWRRTEAWSFPETVLARFRPMSSSGGGFGPDGLIYVTGHDHPELYVLRLPKGGSTLEHLATVEIPIEGQAIAFDRARPGVVFGISRSTRELVEVRLPKVQ